MLYNYLLPQDIKKLSRFCPDALQETFMQAHIMSLPSTGLSLKKKRFGRKEVYTCAANYGRHYHRLIFEKIDIEGKDVYVLRDIAWHHDYTKALNWQPWVELRQTAIPVNYALYECNTLEIPSSSGTIVQYNERWYELTAIQSEVLSRHSFPQLIVGPPGSGKTLTLMALFQEQAQQHQETEKGVFKMLYLTGSKELCDLLQSSWRHWAHRELNKSGPLVIAQFLTFETLLRWSRANQTLLGETEVLERIRHSLPRDSKLSAEEALSEILTQSYILNEDFNNKHTFEASVYRQLGINQSLVSMEKRANIYCLFEKMRTVFDANQEYVAGFSPLEAVGADYPYHLTAVDEAQNVTVQDILNALAITRDQRVVLVGDSLQKGAIKKASLSLLAPALHRLGIGLTCSQLPGSHRLKPDVERMANELVLLSTNLRQGLPDSVSYSSIRSQNQQLNVDNKSLSLVREYSVDYQHLGQKSSAAAVILDVQDRERAKEFIAGKNVFTVYEAQGLEFSELLLYLSEATLGAFTSVNEEMQRLGIDSNTDLAEKTNFSPLKGGIDSPALTLLSNLYVALSRSYGNVWVYMEPINDKNCFHQVEVFWLWLESKFERGDVKKVEARASSLEEWLQSINEFIRKNQLTQARDNLILHFELTEALAGLYIKSQPYIECVMGLRAWCEEQKAVQKTVAAPSALKVERTLSRKEECRVSLPNLAALKPAPLSPQSLSTAVDANRSVLMTSPISDKLAEYVEAMFKSYDSETNLLRLLKLRNAAQLLFYHKMSNGQCLFVNFCLNSSIITKVMIHMTAIIKKDSQMRATVSTLFSSAEQYARAAQDLLLRLMVSHEVSGFATNNKLTIEGLGEIRQMLDDAQSEGSLTPFGSLFKGFDNNINLQILCYIRKKLSSFVLSTQNLISQHQYPNGTVGPSFLHVLTLDFEEWRQFFNTSTSKMILKDALAIPITNPESGQGGNVLYGLI